MSFILLGILNSQVEAVGGGAAYELIQSSLITTNTASVTFSNLDTYSTTYKHLQLRVLALDSNASTTLNPIEMRFNSDSGTNYSSHRIEGTGAAVASLSAASQNRISITSAMGRATNIFGASVIDILDAFSTSKNKTVRSLNGGVSTANPRIQLFSGAWYSTSSITAIEIYNNGANFVSGSRFSLYGIKG